MTEKTRLYFHGDPADGSPEKYYCEWCDLFVSRDHFDECSLGVIQYRRAEYHDNHPWRYMRGRKAVQGMPAEWRSRYMDDPGNLFRTDPVSKQKLPLRKRA